MLTVINKSILYFNCTNITGIELANGRNSENLTNSHWDSRILLGEYMLSDIYYQEQIISEFTLALLEDLGWYKVNYYTGGLMKFGKNKGCQFLFNDCIHYLSRVHDRHRSVLLPQVEGQR